MINEGQKYHKDGRMYTVKKTNFDARGLMIDLEDSCGHIKTLTATELLVHYSQYIPGVQVITQIK